MKTKNNEPTVVDTLNETCYWELDIASNQLFWSDGLCLLLGLSKSYPPTLQQLVKYCQPEQNIGEAFNRAIQQGIPFELKLPSLTADDKIIMVCTTGSPIYDDYGKCIAIKGTLQTEFSQENLSKNNATNTDNFENHKVRFDNFAYIVSHNLRANTSNLQLLLESLQHKPNCKEMEELIGSLKTISSKLNQTVGQLNALTKV